MPFEFTRDLAFIRDLLPPRGSRGVPSAWDETILLQLDAFGTSRYRNLKGQGPTGAVGANIVVGSQISTDKEVAFVWMMHALHSDVANHTLQLGFRITGLELFATMDIYVTDPLSVPSSLSVSLKQPIIVPPKSAPIARMEAGVAGQTISLLCISTPAPIGEYVRW